MRAEAILFRVAVLGGLPSLVQLAAVAQLLVEIPSQDRKDEDLVAIVRCKHTVDSNLDIGLRRWLDRQASHLLTVHDAAKRELAAPLVFRLRAADANWRPRLALEQVLNVFGRRSLACLVLAVCDEPARFLHAFLLGCEEDAGRVYAAKVESQVAIPAWRYREAWNDVTGFVETAVDQAGGAGEQPVVGHQELPRGHCLFGPVVFLARECRVVDRPEMNDVDVRVVPARGVPGVPQKLFHPSQVVGARRKQHAALVNRKAPEDRLIRSQPEASLAGLVQPGSFDRRGLQALRIPCVSEQNASRVVR